MQLNLAMRAVICTQKTVDGLGVPKVLYVVAKIEEDAQKARQDPRASDKKITEVVRIRLMK